MIQNNNATLHISLSRYAYAISLEYQVQSKLKHTGCNMVLTDAKWTYKIEKGL